MVAKSMAQAWSKVRLRFACCEAMRAEWFATVGNHLEGLESPDLDGVVEADLLRCARQAARDGVSARVSPFGRRVRAKPHRSAVEHVEEGLDKVWTDAHKGKVLLFSGEVEEYLDGVVSSPFGRARKNHADGTEAEVGRVYHDLRKCTTPSILNAALRWAS